MPPKQKFWGHKNKQINEILEYAKFSAKKKYIHVLEKGGKSSFNCQANLGQNFFYV